MHIKHHFHISWGQKTQSLEFGRIGLIWKKNQRVAKRTFDGPAVSNSVEER